jgi:aspartyl/asparaginyl-tRNA synthetase
VKINSKFLTADVRLTRISLKDGKIEMSGLVKEFMPIEIEVTFADVRATARLVRDELRQVPRRAIERVKARVPFFGGKGATREPTG